jgi:phage-related protein
MKIVNDVMLKAVAIFSSLPGPVQQIIVVTGLAIAILGPFLLLINAIKTAIVALGVAKSATAAITKIATAAQFAFNAVMSANPIALVIIAIAAIIAIIVLLVKNWDTVTKVVGEVWNAIKNFASDAWEALKTFGSRVAGFVTTIRNAFNAIPGLMFEIGKDIVEGLWNGIKSMANFLKDRVTGLFGDVVGFAKKALGIRSPSRVFGGIGKNIAQGLWTGLKAEERYLKNNFENFFGEIIPELTVDSLNLPDFTNFVTQDYFADALSNSSVDYASLAGAGLAWDAVNEQFMIDDTFVVTTAKLSDLMSSDYSIPSLNSASANGATYAITINAGLGTDPYALGREVSAALRKYGTVSANA